MSELSQGDALRLQALNTQALKARDQGNPGGAIPFLEEALSIYEDHKILGNYGDALARSGRYEEAKTAFLRAIEIEPHYDQSHYNLGVVYDDLLRVTGDAAYLSLARDSYKRALDFKVSPQALNNLGNAQTRLLELADAEKSYRRAVKQGWADSRWNLSLCLMMQGKWAEGWDNYEQRPQMVDMFPRPNRWRGENLEGKTLLIVTEQGIGDTVFALRYIPMLRAMGCKPIVFCDATMKRLIERLDVPCIDKGGQPQSLQYDYETMAMSIPGYLTPNGTGPNEPYLSALGVALEGFNVGLCWNGSTVVGPPAERNIPLKLLKPLSEIKGVRLVSLQKGNAVAEMEDCGFDIHDAMTTVKDVYDTACVIQSMDLVISVDTLIPHLAGALGKPCWLMNRFASCWQWGTPMYEPSLYSTVGQFRQQVRGDWSTVVAEIAYGLRFATAHLRPDE